MDCEGMQVALGTDRRNTLRFPLVQIIEQILQTGESEIDEVPVRPDLHRRNI